MIAIRDAQNHCAGMSIKPESLLPTDVHAAMKNESVGERLRLLREALDLKPSEIADSLGIERTYWSRYERGNQGLSASVAALLVVRFGVTLDFLFLGRWDKLPLDLAEKMRKLSKE